MVRRGITGLLVCVVVVTGSWAEEPERLSRDEIGLLVESDGNYSGDEVTDLLMMVITIADEELEREEAERHALAELLESCEIAAEVRHQVERRERWRVRISWTMFGALVTAIAGAVM